MASKAGNLRTWYRGPKSLKYSSKNAKRKFRSATKAGVRAAKSGRNQFFVSLMVSVVIVSSMTVASAKREGASSEEITEKLIEKLSSGSFLGSMFAASVDSLRNMIITVNRQLKGSFNKEVMQQAKRSWLKMGLNGFGASLAGWMAYYGGSRLWEEASLMQASQADYVLSQNMFKTVLAYLYGEGGPDYRRVAQRQFEAMHLIMIADPARRGIFFNNLIRFDMLNGGQLATVLSAASAGSAATIIFASANPVALILYCTLFGVMATSAAEYALPVSWEKRLGGFSKRRWVDLNRTLLHQSARGLNAFSSNIIEMNASKNSEQQLQAFISTLIERGQGRSRYLTELIAYMHWTIETNEMLQREWSMHAFQEAKKKLLEDKYGKIKVQGPATPGFFLARLYQGSILQDWLTDDSQDIAWTIENNRQKLKEYHQEFRDFYRKEALWLQNIKQQYQQLSLKNKLTDCVDNMLFSEIEKVSFVQEVFTQKTAQWIDLFFIKEGQELACAYEGCSQDLPGDIIQLSTLLATWSHYGFNENHEIQTVLDQYGEEHNIAAENTLSNDYCFNQIMETPSKAYVKQIGSAYGNGH
ncbi:hypothetical protein MRY82_01215 [bacterium]|nr:hypothetical protein [bacterium]